MSLMKNTPHKKERTTMKRGIGMKLAVAGAWMGLAMLAPATGWAHCDTMNGPVIPEARKNKDKSVEAGREFVESYVIYMHYVEGIHTAIMSAGGHGHTEAPAGHAEQEKHAH